MNILGLRGFFLSLLFEIIPSTIGFCLNAFYLFGGQIFIVSLTTKIFYNGQIFRFIGDGVFQPVLDFI